MAQKWNTLSHKQQQQLSQQFELLILQLFENGDDRGFLEDLMSEPSIKYTSSANRKMKRKTLAQIETNLSEEKQELQIQKVQAFFENLSADFTGYKFDRNEANER